MTTAHQLPAPGDPPQALQIADPRRQLQTYAPAGPSSHATDDEDIIDLKEYWQILVRRRWTIILSAMLAVVLAVIATFNATPIYRSTLLMQIDRQTNQVVDYGNVMPEDGGTLGVEGFLHHPVRAVEEPQLGSARDRSAGAATDRREDEDEEPSFFSRGQGVGQDLHRQPFRNGPVRPDPAAG